MTGVQTCALPDLASPGKNINFRTMSPLALLRVTSSSIGLQLVVQPYPVTFSLIATSYSSVQYFALDFLQILLHNEHPCHQLMVPTTTAHSGLSPPS